MKFLTLILFLKLLLIGNEDYLEIDEFNFYDGFNNYDDFNQFSEFNEFEDFNNFTGVSNMDNLGIEEINIDGIKKTNIHEKTIVKSRAKRPSNSRSIYIYVDDRDVRGLNLYSHRRKNQVVNIASPVIDDRSRVNKVKIVVDLDRDLKIKKNRYRQNNIVNIASPEIDNGSRVKDIDILIDAQAIHVK